MATLEKEDLGFKREQVDLHEIVSKAISSIEVPLSEREGTIEKNLTANHSNIIGDKMHLTNIIYNLLDNSIKYSKGKPEIEISTYNRDNKVTIEIKDRGIGIAPEYTKKVFHKFFRVPTGNIHDVKGFGLGLNYVQIIVKALHGEINLESEVGKGSTFTISFPTNESTA